MIKNIKLYYFPIIIGMSSIMGIFHMFNFGVYLGSDSLEYIELAKKIGFDLSERDLEIHSTEISFYNTNNVAQLLNDMKPKAKESRADKIARVKAYQQSVAVN
jgi:hypothetical protein